MKKIINIKSLYFIVFGMLFSMTSCDLSLQEAFEFEPEVDLTDPYDNMTAWEFIQFDTALSDEGNLMGEQLNYMVAAIKRAGMESEYSGSDTSRTYLLLNNNAFTGGGDVIQIVTGSSTVSEGETPDDVMARADVETLRKVLEYHIVTTHVKQVPTLYEYGVNYIFQTLIPGEDGVIVMRRDDRYRIDINRAPAPLPSSATSQWERVRKHNYVFNNGIGHFLNDPVRNKPY
ncbi:MAG: hypothetical protein HKN68_00765 [Saprospiraceae bacterium]|nr:hypothetical protein [Saprospiraceae bacterium]